MKLRNFELLNPGDSKWTDDFIGEVIPHLYGNSVGGCLDLKLRAALPFEVS